MDHAPSLDELVKQADALYAEQFGESAKWIVAAPGRVNLIGEHTDYNEGFVMPMAIERYVVIAAGRPTDDAPGDQVTAYSQLLEEKSTLTVSEAPPAQLAKWCVYPHGVLDLFRKRDVTVTPLNMVVLSTVPLGGGLSSSAAFEVATATLVEAITGESLDGREKAKLCQQAENEYAGVPCGIMDQYSSALCEEGAAMALDCRSLEPTPVPMNDPAVTLLLINSNVKHDLGESEYPERRACCESAAEKLGVPFLRDATLEMLDARKAELTDNEYRRARHIISDSARVGQLAAALAAGDFVLAGQLMYASHQTQRDDFEVSCPEVDKLVELAEAIGLEGGVYGSRITGGGFGGCTVTLCQTDKAEAIAELILADYQTVTGIQASAFVTRPARGAHIVRG